MLKVLAVPAALALIVVVTAAATPDTLARAQAQSSATAAPAARIAQLAPAPAAPDLKPVKINPGVVYNKAGRALAPLAVDSPSGTNYALKLVNASNGKEAMMIYVIGGKPFQTKAPLGTYKIRGASGATWYGIAHLFGKDTSYFKLRSKGSGRVEGDNFTFYRKGNQVHGFRITLIKQADGNLETDPIKPEEF